MLSPCSPEIAIHSPSVTLIPPNPQPTNQGVPPRIECQIRPLRLNPLLRRPRWLLFYGRVSKKRLTNTNNTVTSPMMLMVIVKPILP